MLPRLALSVGSEPPASEDEALAVALSLLLSV
jgi:hypothetical protein